MNTANVTVTATVLFNQVSQMLRKSSTTASSLFLPFIYLVVFTTTLQRSYVGHCPVRLVARMFLALFDLSAGANLDTVHYEYRQSLDWKTRFRSAEHADTGTINPTPSPGHQSHFCRFVPPAPRTSPQIHPLASIFVLKFPVLASDPHPQPE